MNAEPAKTRLAPWSTWVLENLQLGVLVLDDQARVVFANQWFLHHADLSPQQILGQVLEVVFPQLARSSFMLFLRQAMRSGYPALLSQTLHPAPFPLFVPSNQRNQDKLLRQSIRIIPAASAVADEIGHNYTLVQISDVTHSVLRERLLKAQANKLQDMAHIDSLTGLGNRRLLDDKLASELRSAGRQGSPLAVVMFDIDYFKQFNDLYGHLAGDDSLRQVAGVLRETCRRPHDVVARYGGEELLAILRETNLAGALQQAHLVMQRVQALGIAHAGSAAAPVLTLSAGVAISTPERAQSCEEMINQADLALYRAKAAGRNQVCGPLEAAAG